MRTLITPWPSESRPSTKRKPKIPSIIIPHTPINITGHPPLINQHKIGQISLPSSITPQSLTGGLSFATSKSLSWQDGTNGPALDIIALAGLFATLKRAVSSLHATFEELGSQTKKLANFAPVIQVDHQIESARVMLEQQIARHEKSMQEVRHVLENAVHKSMVEKLKAQIAEVISDNVAKEVRSRVQQELSKQLLGRLKRHGHTREIFETHTVLCHSEARRHNLSSSCMDTERWRPLLRPLPSALQSPAYLSELPFTTNNSTKDASPLTLLSMPTTVTVAEVYAAGNEQDLELVSPTPWPLLSRDMKPLFELEAGAAKQPLTDRGHETVPYSRLNPDQPEVIVRVNTSTGLETGVLNTEVSPTVEIYTTCERDINGLIEHVGGRFPKLCSQRIAAQYCKLPFSMAISFLRRPNRILLIPLVLAFIGTLHLVISNQYQIKNVLSYATRPLWDEVDGPKNKVSHYYAEGMKMDRHACQLHGWNEREARDNVKVIDAVLMSSELDLLEIRMNELDSVVDNFFIIESNATFTGLPKETYFAKNKERFYKFEKKIVYKLQVCQCIPYDILIEKLI
ncbi:hypothetical protein C0993_003492 [Termitomyces sp. T159_Od127]|nr:hypothetical protein C0993_003492 [Termitomyces sp. T159_Od127]